MMFISVVLPEPDGPKIATNSPPVNCKIHVPQHRHQLVSQLIALLDAFHFDNLFCCLIHGSAPPQESSQTLPTN